MRRPFPGWGLLASASLALLISSPAHAALPELRLSPLKYVEHLELGHPKVGWIQADNPTGTTMHLDLEVQAFRQINDRGELEYYDDERVKSAITPGITSFDLGPRDAIRVKFEIDPNRLGTGGAYGVIFLRASSGNTSTSQINTTERIGTLLILDVGGSGTKNGQIAGLSMPALAFGTNPVLPITFAYANTGIGPKALAFTPSLTATVGWFGKPQPFTGPFVFPGRARSTYFKATLGSHFGPSQITIRDNTSSGHPTTRWVFLITGFWTWLAPLLLCLIFFAVASWFRRQAIYSALTRYIRRMSRSSVLARQFVRAGVLALNSRRKPNPPAPADTQAPIVKKRGRSKSTAKNKAKSKAKTKSASKSTSKPRKRKYPKTEV